MLLLLEAGRRGGGCGSRWCGAIVGGGLQDEASGCSLHYMEIKSFLGNDVMYGLLCALKYALLFT